MKTVSEEWKPLKGVVECGDYYEVSSTGKLRNAITGKVKSLQKQSNGYLRSYLYLKGRKKGYDIHRLVALTFIPQVEGKNEVNHINGNKEDNNVNNLEWCSRSENINHAIKTGLINKHNITKHLLNISNQRKKKPVACYDIKTGRLVKTFPYVNAVKADGFHPTNVSSCCRGLREQHKGFIWKYYTG